MIKHKKLISMLMILTISLTSLVGCSNNEKATSNINTSQNNDVTDIMKDGTESSIDDILGNNSNTESQSTDNREIDLNNPNKDTDSNNDTENINTSDILSKICEFRIIDCGQADSILLHSKDFTVLVDAGEEKEAKEIRKVLDNLGVKKIDLLVATHPHLDHIGGMETIINNYDIDKILMSPSGHTSKTYENLLKAIDSKEKTITKATVGEEFNINGLKLKVIGPCNDYSDLNDDSVVILSSYGETDVLLTGDAGLQAEKDFVNYLTDVEVLKVGHHGSDTSTSDNLLDTVTPEVATISCGKDNDYGHPNKETLDKINKRSIKCYITADCGDIIIRTDGTDYTVETTKDGLVETGNKNQTTTSAKEPDNETQSSEAQNNNNQNDDKLVYVSQSGKKYHSSEQCSRLFTSKQINEMTEQEAIAQGITKCSKCW